MPRRSPIRATATLADVLTALRPGDYLLLPATSAPAAPSVELPPQPAPLLAGLPPGRYALLSNEVTWEELSQEV